MTFLLMISSAWNLKTLEIKWRIRPRSCKKMYDQFYLFRTDRTSYQLYRGSSAVSPNEKVLAVTNLYDDIDWYSLISNHSMDASFFFFIKFLCALGYRTLCSTSLKHVRASLPPCPTELPSLPFVYSLPAIKSRPLSVGTRRWEFLVTDVRKR